MPGGKAAEPHRAGAVVPAEDDMELCITKSSVVDDAQATADEPEHHVRSPACVLSPWFYSETRIREQCAEGYGRRRSLRRSMPSHRRGMHMTDNVLLVSK